MRRRSGVVAIVLVIVGGVAAVRAWAPDPIRPAAVLDDPSASASSVVDDQMPPALLAWISGPLPRGFSARVAAEPALGTTVVVAGDTRWLRVSHDRNGRVIDRPTPPYEIPIDAFAVDPTSYAPFLPPMYRAAVTSALSDGTAVLGGSSAALRRIAVGGTLSFEAGDVEVGAIVPDQVAGYSEMLVSRSVGRRLGIVDDRYLLSIPSEAMSAHRFAGIVDPMLPGISVRTVGPGAARYMRVASGVNPPVVIKGIFGEFAAYPQTADPAFLNMSPSWYDGHIATRSVPLLGNVTCNRALFPMLIGALTDVQAAGLGAEIHTYSGCYAARTVARSPTAPPSQHAYGAAIDINAPENPYGATPTMDPTIVKIFQRRGFVWGGDFLTPDGMHFEYGGAPTGG